nr:transporter substrate-binding domain-containing protein [Streptomyces sp. YSPA8]
MIDGRFELLARLGGGGMGLVWRARDLALHREVALKEVRPPDPALTEYDPDGARELRARVLREARALARVDHPHVVTIHHIVDGGEGTYPWLVMELVTGGSLQDRLGRGVLTPGEAARLGRGVLAGLRAAHDAGIQHRDIKPANVLLRPDGRPVLTDFGIAAIRDSTALTATGSLIGTPDYMAPERVAGEDAGPAADLWSLALMLYAAVEGRNPLRRANTLATLAAVLSEDVPPPTSAGPLTGALTAVLVRDPGARPTAGELDGLLARAESDAEAGAGAEPVAGGRDTPTSYPLAPPDRTPSADVPPAPAPAQSTPVAQAPQPPRPSVPVPAFWRRRRWAVALTAVPLAGVLLWTLLPEGDNGDDKPAGGEPAGGESADSQKITIGIKFDQPGLGLKTSDTYTGFDVDVATYIARELGHDPEDIVWKEAMSAERERMLTSGEVDYVVATYTINEKRKQEVDFVGPYLVAGQDVLMSVTQTAIVRPADLNGKKVCGPTGSSTLLNIRTRVAPEAVIEERPSYTRCLTDLSRGAVDAVTADDAILAGYAAQNPDKYRLGGFRLTEERYGIGVPKGSHLKAGIEAALKKMETSKEWIKSLEKNLPQLQRGRPLS